MKITKLLLTAALVLAPAGAFAQTSTAHQEPVKNTIGAHKENQQDRIAQGINAGTLSPAEAARLEHQEAKINRQERDMREDDHGKLTAADRARLRREQARESKRIYNKKHDLNGNK